MGEQVGHENITYGSRMNKAVVAFLREERLVHVLVESGLTLDDLFVAVSPLYVPSARITVSGVPPFIPSESLERELARYGKFSSGFATIRLGCKDSKLQHVQSLRRQAFMYLNDPAQSLDISFKVKHEGGYYTVYASSGSMKCFECGDVGHKRASCPHREQASSGTGEQQAESSGTGEQQAESSGTGVQQGTDTDSAVTGIPQVTQSAEVAETSTPYADSLNNGVTVQPAVKEGRSSGQTEREMVETPVAENPSETPGELNGEKEEEEVMEDDCLSQFSDLVSQDEQQQQQTYSLKEINNFLDETYGTQNVEITDFFPNVDKFIYTVLKIRKMADYEQLSKQKRFRLKKILTKIRKEKRGKAPLKA